LNQERTCILSPRLTATHVLACVLQYRAPIQVPAFWARLDSIWAELILSLFRVEQVQCIPLGPPPQAYPPVNRPLPQTPLARAVSVIISRNRYPRHRLCLSSWLLLFFRRSSPFTPSPPSLPPLSIVCRPEHLLRLYSPRDLCLPPLSLPSIWFVLVSSLVPGQTCPSIPKSSS